MQPEDVPGELVDRAMTDRCEPPEHLRGVDGWHWLGNDCPVFWIAEDQEWDWTEDERVGPNAAYRYGYRYHSPVSTPSEVAALRAERDDWRRKAGEGWQAASDEAQKADAIRDRLEALQDVLDEGDAENATLRARVETLEAALKGIASWCEAYPASVFPQASADAALSACKAAGIPTDAMHGTWARHLLSGIGRDARDALEEENDG